MKKLLPFVAFLCLAGFAGAQNLVVNPGFEDHSACPDTACNIADANGWYNTSGIAAYFNTCGSNGFGVPNNKFGYHQASSGSAYAEFGVFNDFDTYVDNIGQQFASPLTVGHKYFVSFKISLAGRSSAATNRMGVGFSTVSDSAACGVYYVHQSNMKFYEHSIISDTVNWTTISTSFIADSAYRFITIGYLNLDTVHFIYLDTSALLRAVYYIDDICLSTDSMTCTTAGIAENSLNNELINIFPNPASSNITISSPSNSTIEISNIQGQLLKTFTSCGNKINVDHDGWSSHVVNVSDLPCGMYIVEVISEKGIAVKKFVKE